MALLTVNTATAVGVTPAGPAQISAWASADTISGDVVSAGGVLAIVSNTSGGALDFRVEDPGATPAGNGAANGYATITVPNNQYKGVFIGPGNVNRVTNTVKVGASTTNAGFTVQLWT